MRSDDFCNRFPLWEPVGTPLMWFQQFQVLRLVATASHWFSPFSGTLRVMVEEVTLLPTLTVGFPNDKLI